MENALAFDAEDLSTVNTSILLANLTKSVIIKRFEFTNALEYGLKESSTLCKHIRGSFTWLLIELHGMYGLIKCISPEGRHFLSSACSVAS
jgi:hypothetical protein